MAPGGFLAKISKKFSRNPPPPPVRPIPSSSSTSLLDASSSSYVPDLANTHGSAATTSVDHDGDLPMPFNLEEPFRTSPVPSMGSWPLFDDPSGPSDIEMDTLSSYNDSQQLEILTATTTIMYHPFPLLNQFLKNLKTRTLSKLQLYPFLSF
jgi:hypothetical protein